MNLGTRGADEARNFTINRSDEEVIAEFHSGGYQSALLPEHIAMWDEDKFAVNTFENPGRVVPNIQNDIVCENNIVTAKLSPLSWNVIRI